MMKGLFNLTRNERGQSLVLIALGAIALFGFVALAIDGGMAYAQRRTAQNAADSGAVAGAYTVRVQNNNYGRDESELLAAVNTAVEGHGVPDTNGTPKDSKNDNVTVYYTDDKGRILGGGCQVGSCPLSVRTSAWGLEVHVRKPFQTFFAGVVGWKEITVQARANAVARPGAKGYAGDYWVLFSMNSDNCSTSVKGVDVSGSRSQIVGHVHSNTSVSQTGSSSRVDGAISYVGDCIHCRSSIGEVDQVSPINTLVLPDFNAYKELAWNETSPGAGSASNRYNSTLTVRNNQKVTIGSPGSPFTYIRGDLDINNGAEVTMHGLIFVEGNVNMNGKTINDNSFTIVTHGTINVQQMSPGFTNEPYTNPRYPILKDNVARFYTDSGGTKPRPCMKDSVVSISGSENIMRGGIFAPNGTVEISGSSNEFYTSIIASEIDISGARTYIDYANGAYFPPQPDRIELLE